MGGGDLTMIFEMDFVIQVFPSGESLVAQIFLLLSLPHPLSSLFVFWISIGPVW